MKKLLLILACQAVFTGFAVANTGNSGQNPTPGSERKLVFEQEGVKVFAMASTCADQPSTLFQIENQNKREVKLIMVVNSGSTGLPDLRNISVAASSTLSGSCETPELTIKGSDAIPAVQVTIVR